MFRSRAKEEAATDRQKMQLFADAIEAMKVAEAALDFTWYEVALVEAAKVVEVSLGRSFHFRLQ